MLATERLAAELVSPNAFALPPRELTAAKQRLARAFQEAWLDECRRLVDAEHAASSRTEAP